jgi:flagellar basal-body rod protein FlgG
MDGKGFFVIDTPDGLRYTRNGSFIINKEGVLVTKEGYRVMGEKGEIRIKDHNYKIDDQGRVIVNMDEHGDPMKMTDPDQNEWKRPAVLDSLRIVNFENLRYVKKTGNSFFMETKYRSRDGCACRASQGLSGVSRGIECQPGHGDGQDDRGATHL